MCELTLANSGDKELNSFYLWNQMLVNTIKDNQHGFGFFGGDKIIKSKLCPQIVTNLGFLLNKFVSDQPVIAHVRAATAVQGKAIDISDESAHPFEGEKIILAHNGKLKFKKPKYYKEYPDVKVDSIIFMKELEKRYNGGNFVSAIKDTMPMFTGTFAFLIFSKLEHKYFVVRGDTKKLHYVDLPTGFAVNTVKEDLETALVRTQAMYHLLDAEFPEESIVVELDKESIFEVLPEKLEKIGEIEENKEYVWTATTANSYKEFNNWRDEYDDDEWLDDLQQKSELAKRIADFMLKNHFTIFEVDHLLYGYYGKGIMECGQELISELVSFTFSYSDAKALLWNRLVSSVGDEISTYIWHSKLKFPWTENTEQELRDAIEAEKKLAGNSLPKE